MVRRVALTLLILSACSRELRLQPAKSPSARIDPVPPALGRDGAELHLAVSFASRGSDLALDLVRWADDEAPGECDFWLREPSNDDWSTEKSSLLPPPRAGMGATYDALRGRVVLFGGHGESVEADAGAADFRTGYLGDTWQLTADAPHARYAAEEVAFAVPADAEVSALALAYAGSASGANGAAPVNLAVWLDDGGWLPMGADGGAIALDPALPDGGYAPYVFGDRVWLLASAPPSSDPASGHGAVPSVLSTNYVELDATYLLP